MESSNIRYRSMTFVKFTKKAFLILFVITLLLLFSTNVMVEIAATHIYHNHIPNFWPYYDVNNYGSISVGEEIS
ncbi:hypothetical protein ES708_05994 [subsurface metagenome]